jgi:Fe-S-cluster-containing hydrogenase component 2
MGVRRIITVDEDRCDGCGLCADACHEGAIRIVEGKARLVSETYCDGLGDCIGECPRDAIRIEEREAAPFDANGVEAHLARATTAPTAARGCPGSTLRSFEPPAPATSDGDAPSQLRHWPVQLMLVPPGAPFLKGADLLVTADCVPFATADYHRKYLAGRSVIVGCPKLDDIQFYYEKLKSILAESRPRSITVLCMEVPCCGGIGQAVTRARNDVAPDIDLKIITIGVRGDELGSETIP